MGGTGNLGQGIGELGAGNWDRELGGRELGEGNWRQQTGDRELGTGNWRQGTEAGNWEASKLGNREVGTGNWGRELGRELEGKELGTAFFCTSRGAVCAGYAQVTLS